jgi:hypothetical protein
MLAQAEQISDPVKRQGFLEKVKVNQEITAALALAETAGVLIAT